MSTAAQGFSGAYPFFHRGATTLHFLEPIEVGTDPTISPGWARPLGWRVATADGLLAWDKTGPADTDWTPVGPGAIGTIDQITSDDGSVVITNPLGPIVDLSVAAAASSANLFDVTLSFGHGMDIDAVLPPATSFWLTATTITDLARADQVRQWPVDQALSFIGLDVVVSESSGIGELGLALIVTLGGLDTALSITVPTGITEDTLFSTSAMLPVPAGSFVGVRVDGSGVGESESIRLQARLHGAATGTPVIPSTLPIDALALYRPEDLASDGSSWTDSVAGNLYSLTVPSSSTPPAWITPISGPTRIDDGSFNGHPYGHYTSYNDPLFGINYTPNMLATHVAMFAGSVAPIAPRTLVAVCRPSTAIGGIVGTTQFTTPCWKGALYKPAGDLTQAACFTINKGATQTNDLITPVSLAAQEVVLIWRTNGTTLDFFIDGVLQPLDTDTIGSDNAAGGGFCLGNLASATYTSQDGFRGDICFGGVWARAFTDAEVLAATGNLSTLYVTP
jgi:hypothetical protein